MNRYATQLATLKEKIQKEPKFADVVAYYTDELGNRAFYDQGAQVTEPALLETILGAAAQVLGLPVARASGAQLKRLPEHLFVHGVFQMGPSLCMVFFFEDIRQGILATGSESGPSQFSRITLVARDAGSGALH